MKGCELQHRGAKKPETGVLSVGPLLVSASLFAAMPHLNVAWRYIEISGTSDRMHACGALRTKLSFVHARIKLDDYASSPDLQHASKRKAAIARRATDQ